MNFLANLTNAVLGDTGKRKDTQINGIEEVTQKQTHTCGQLKL